MKVIKISVCNECPHFNYTIGRCNRGGAMLTELNKEGEFIIPNSCKLEDVE